MRHLSSDQGKDVGRIFVKEGDEMRLEMGSEKEGREDDRKK
jgi:hypothetical protein